MYEQYYFYAAALLALTITSGFLSTRRLYQKRLQLYRAVAQVNFVPLVQGGYVRYPALSLCMSVHPVSTAVCEFHLDHLPIWSVCPCVNAATGLQHHTTFSGIVAGATGISIYVG